MTIASVAPRVRSAGSPMTPPITAVITTVTRIIKGNGRCMASFAPMRAPSPASANWASDSCPAYPVMTTTERQMTPSEIV